MEKQRNYYYLVAGLADLQLDSGKRLPGARDFVLDIAPQVHPDDAALFNFLFHPFDNSNLLAILEKRDEFDTRALWGRDAFAERVKYSDGLPSYMREFIEAFREGSFPFPDLLVENQLAWLFYEYACTQKNDFIRQWFDFDLNVRNVLTALNCRAAASRFRSGERVFQLHRAIICRNDIAQTILRSSAPDFSLTAQLPWLESLLTLPRDNLVEFEKGVDQIRWDMLNELTTFSYFSFDVILAFTIKLGIVERWQHLDEQTGGKKLDQLLNELTAAVAANAGF